MGGDRLTRQHLPQNYTLLLHGDHNFFRFSLLRTLVMNGRSFYHVS